MLVLKTIISGFLVFLHPFYVSITSVDYNEKSQSMEVSCRIFYDDLEDALKASSNKQIDLINPPNKQAVDSVLGDYLLKHLRLSVNGKQITLQYLGYEIEDDVAWCFLEAGNIAEVKNIRIDNHILFGQFPKQSNIMHVTANGTRKSVKLDNPKGSVAITF